MKNTLLWKYHDGGEREPSKFHNWIHKIFGTYIYPEKIKSKEWWKSQLKIRDKWIFLYGFWVVYGGWLLMKAITPMIYDIPVTRFTVANGYMIGFIWFFFYSINLISEKDHRKFLWKLIDLYRERGDEYWALIEKIHKAVEEEKQKEEQK